MKEVILQTVGYIENNCKVIHTGRILPSSRNICLYGWM